MAKEDESSGSGSNHKKSGRNNNNNRNNRSSTGGGSNTNTNSSNSNTSSNSKQRSRSTKNNRRNGNGNGNSSSQSTSERARHSHVHEQENLAKNQSNGNNSGNGNQNINQNSNVNARTNNQTRRGRNNRNRNRHNNRNNNRNDKILYPDYTPLKECLQRYANAQSSNKTKSASSSKMKIARGKLRTNAGGGTSFVSCDRGIYGRDLIIDGEMGRNRAMDGDIVFVEILCTVEEYQNNGNSNANGSAETTTVEKSTLKDHMTNMTLNVDEEGDAESMDSDQVEDNDDDDDMDDMDDDTWQEDEPQRMLWDPIVPIAKKRKNKKRQMSDEQTGQGQGQGQGQGHDQDLDQYMCRVIHVLPPHNATVGVAAGTAQPSELNPTQNDIRDGTGNGKNGNTGTGKAKRTIVGTLKAHNNKCLFVPNSRSLPRFLCPASITPAEYIHNSTGHGSNGNKNGAGNRNGKRNGKRNGNTTSNNNDTNTNTGTLYKAEYIYGSWPSTAKWPPCINVKAMGQSCNIEDETNALLIEYGVNHGDFNSCVLKDVNDAVLSGRLGVDDDTNSNDNNDGTDGAAAAAATAAVASDDRKDQTDLGWAPTPDMYKGRRDYRKERIFTIDPTTAKDLDDALHIRPLGDGKVEIGVRVCGAS